MMRLPTFFVIIITKKRRIIILVLFDPGGWAAVKHTGTLAHSYSCYLQAGLPGCTRSFADGAGRSSRVLKT